MKKILLLCIISSHTFATNLTLDNDIRIKIEYDTRTEKIKILSKKNSKNKECMEQINESKRLIKSSIRGKSGKFKMDFICRL